MDLPLLLQVKAKEFADRFELHVGLQTLKGKTLFLHIGAEEKSAVHIYKIFHVTEMNFKTFFRIMNSKIFLSQARHLPTLLF